MRNVIKSDKDITKEKMKDNQPVVYVNEIFFPKTLKHVFTRAYIVKDGKETDLPDVVTLMNDRAKRMEELWKQAEDKTK